MAVCAETALLALLAQQNLGLLSQQPRLLLLRWLGGLGGRGAVLADNPWEVRRRGSAKPALEEHKANETGSWSN